ncbi:MAG: sulfatase-like hydrolase/transferase [Chitinophagaceae bacterium]
MNRFLLLLWLITLIASLLLRRVLYFDQQSLLFHIGVIVFIQAAFAGGVTLLRLINSSRWRKVLIHGAGYSFLLLYIVFYLSIILSNSLWGKTITLSILSDYVLSLNDLIKVLPVDAWIVYAAFVLLIILSFVLYRLCPIRSISPIKLRGRWKALRKRPALTAIVFVVGAGLILALFKPMLQFKRRAHFAGEPTMEFVWGPMWYPESLEDIYSPGKQANAMAMKECIENVKAPVVASDRINMVVLVDALRRDHLPMYGYARQTTPFLDSMHRAGSMIAVQNAYSTSSGTLIGVAGLFSSRNWNSFAYSGLNLMKFMRRTGHRTYAFLTGHHRTWYGLTAIYRNDTETFYESASSYAQIDVDDLTTLREFENTELKPGSFIYMHLLSTHDLGKKSDEFRKFLPDKIGIGVSQKTALINNYDNGILQTDFVLRKIFEKLSKEGLLEKTTLYLVADHGQLFGEYGQWNHASSINPAVISVPMLIYDNNLEFYKNRQLATLKDVAPSMAARMGLPIPTCWQGHSLGDTLTGFETDINIENKCEIPSARLYYRNDTLWLDHINKFDSLAARAYLDAASNNWKFTIPLP